MSADVTSPTRQEKNVGSRPLASLPHTKINLTHRQAGLKKAVFLWSQQASAVILTCPPRVQHSTMEDMS